MIVLTSPLFLRRLARAGALMVAAVAATALSWTAPAHAKVPEGWETPPAVDTLEALLLLVGAPLGLFLLITIAVLVPSLARGERLGRPEESQWLGGPGKDPKELTVASSGGPETGGASGRW